MAAGAPRRIAEPGEWTELIAPSTHFYMTGIECYRDFFVVEGREDGLDQIAIHRYDPDDRAAADRLPRGELCRRASATIPNMT